MKYLRKIILPILLAATLLLAVRGLLLCHMRLPDNAALPGLGPGGHVLVCLTYYGLRLPGEPLWGYHRWGYAEPEVMDNVVFAPSATAGKPPEVPLMAGTCRAVPGDTVWIDPVRRLVLPARTSPDAQPIVVPGKGRSVHVTPHNARLLAWLLQTYEHSRVTLTREGGLQMAGSRLKRVRTSQNYYWIETQPDTFRLVPHCELVGKIVSQF